MDDMERYGDYTEYEDDLPKSKSKVFLVLKIFIALVCVAVVGIFAFRIIFFNYYPDSMENIYFNDTLTAYYNKTGGNIGAKTQELRAPYDNENTATFFADNLIIIEGAEQLQLSVRINKSAFADLEEKYKIDIPDDYKGSFTFELYRNNTKYDKTDEDSSLFLPIGTLSVVNTDSSLLYEYFKLVFDGVNLSGDEDLGEVKWLSLAIWLDGVEMKEPYRIAVYENNEEYSSFEDYELSKEEHP